MALAIITRCLEKLASSDVWRSDVAACWGAIVATIALSWNVLLDAHLKGHLKVQAMFRVDDMNRHVPPALTVSVTNVGSKPVLVQGIAIQRNKGSTPSHHFFPCEIPKMLAPLNGLFWLTAAAMAYYAIRLRNVPQHKEWMIRTYVLACNGIVGDRILADIPVLTRRIGIDTVNDLSGWLLWALPLMIAEVIIQLRRLRKMRRPQRGVLPT